MVDRPTRLGLDLLGGTQILLVALDLLGGETLTDLAFALLVGIVVGTYSSVFTATPLAVWVEGRRDVRLGALAGPRRKPAKGALG